MIDDLGVNDKVGSVRFNVTNNKYSADLIMKMASKYDNVWSISISDETLYSSHINVYVDNNIYD